MNEITTSELTHCATIDKYDRERQRLLLKTLYDATPHEITPEQYDEFSEIFGSEEIFVSNLLYLEGHGLISSGVTSGYGSIMTQLVRLKITSRGIDFIRDDGGLGAILDVQVIKFHNSTIIAIEDILAVTNLPEKEKKSIVAKLRELPADTIKHLTLQLLTKAVMNPQAVIQIIQTALHH